MGTVQQRFLVLDGFRFEMRGSRAALRNKVPYSGSAASVTLYRRVVGRVGPSNSECCAFESQWHPELPKNRVPRCSRCRHGKHEHGKHGRPL